MVKKHTPSATLIFLFVLASCSQEPEKFNDLQTASALYRLGENMRASGDHSAALKLYHQALALDPDYQEATLRVVDTLKVDGKFEECRSILDKLILKNPRDDKILHALGKVTIAQNDGQTCLKTYKTLVESYPSNPTFLNGLAICHDLLNQHRQAHTYYQQAITQAPDNLNIQSNYGLSLALDGRTTEAIDLLLKLHQRSQSTLNIKHNLAVAYGLAGQIDKSQQLFQSDLEPTALAQNIKVLTALKVKVPKRPVDQHTSPLRKYVGSKTLPSSRKSKRKFGQ